MNENYDNSEDVAYILIDPPITPFSSEKDILAWIEELNTYPDRPEVREAILQAKEYIKMKVVRE